MAEKGSRRDPFVFNQRSFKDQKEFVRFGRRCGTCAPSDLQIFRVDEEIRGYRATGTRIESVVIPVKFVHIVDDQEGQVSEQQRTDQLKVLNDAFNAYGISFVLSAASTHFNPAWFAMGYGSAGERAAKRALGGDPRRVLNFYTAGLQPGLLGWATFPSDLAGDPERDGVVMLHSTLPGGSATPYNLGKTGVHEVGHWLGLYHTFEPKGMCGHLGDHVSDTVEHRDPDFGKPTNGVAGCNSGEFSPIHNYMNYTDDEWLTEFTSQQGQRMLDQVGMYRTELVSEMPPVQPAVTPMKLEAAETGSLAATEAEKMFMIPLPADATVKLEGPNLTDFDLYVKRGMAPTISDYGDRGYTDSSDESIKLRVNQPGDYFIMVQSYKGSGDFQLSVELD